MNLRLNAVLQSVMFLILYFHLSHKENLLQLNLRKMMNCLEQHNGLQLADAVPSLMEVLNMNCAAFKSLNINSLVQIGYYVMEEGNVLHKENNEYISRLVSVLLNSVVNENKEKRVMRDKFLFAVWCRTGEIVFLLHVCVHYLY